MCYNIFMKKFIIIFLVVIFLIILLLNYFNIPKRKTYDSLYFNIDVVKSDVDYDNDGIDDYTDIVLTAIEEGKKRPTYKSKYYDGGYPNDSEGVCTDLIWRSLKGAGYDFKSMIDDDIKNNLSSYTKIKKPDPNIDFRRVYNIHVFLKNNYLSLTNDVSDIAAFQPGDIVIFNNDTHIGIVSNKRNKKGYPYVIHHVNSIRNKLNNLEEDVLLKYKVNGHYRFQKKTS